MKTPGKQINILYSLLSDSDLLNAVDGRISGDIYKHVRPNSGKEDIVVSSISLVGQSKQFGSAVVNIWIPDNEQSFPDTKRIDYLAAKAVEIIENAFSLDYNITIGNQDIYAEPELKYHFYSITVNFEFFNL